MSRRISACSSSKRNSASARANSVFPTPVGPRKMKLPTGRFGSLRPDLARSTASCTASTALSWPTTRLCSSSPRWSNFCTSLEQLGDRDSGPPADHLGDILFVHLFFDQWGAALFLRKLFGFALELVFELDLFAVP